MDTRLVHGTGTGLDSDMGSDIGINMGMTSTMGINFDSDSNLDMGTDWKHGTLIKGPESSR